MRIRIYRFVIAYGPGTIHVSLRLNEVLAATPPNIFQYRSTTGYKYPVVFIISHQPMSPPDRDGRSASEGLLDDGHDVGEVVDIRMIWESLATQNVVELTLGRSHDFRVPSHRKKKAIQHSAGLDGRKNFQFAEAIASPHTVSDIPTRDDQEEDRRLKYAVPA